MFNRYFNDPLINGTKLKDYLTTYKKIILYKLDNNIYSNYKNIKYFLKCHDNDIRVKATKFVERQLGIKVDTDKNIEESIDYYISNIRIKKLNKVFILPYNQAANIDISDIEETNIILTKDNFNINLDFGTGVVWTINNDNGPIYVGQTCDWINEYKLMIDYLNHKINPNVNRNRAKQIISYKPTYIKIHYILKNSGKNMKNSNKRIQLLACESIINQNCIIKQ